MTHDAVHLADVQRRHRIFQVWERARHRQIHWLVECIAEMMGVFFYVYAGVGSTAAFTIANLTGQPTVGSLFHVGFAYAFGIILAIVVCAPTSGGHFNPCVTIAFAVYRGFPWKKVPMYIFAQVLGGYLSCLIIYLQYYEVVGHLETALKAKGVYDAINFTPQGVAGIFALYAPTGSNLFYVWVNEFVSDFFLGLAIWACLDPTNFFTPPPVAPFIVAFAYACVIWGYAPVGLAANTARDVGGRFMAMSIWGSRASGGSYAAIAALTNIPSMLLAATFYEFFFTDSSRVVPRAHREFLAGHKAHMEHSSSVELREDLAGRHSPTAGEKS